MDKGKLINFAMVAEAHRYSPEIMDLFWSDYKYLSEEEKRETMLFYQTCDRMTFQLYCEIMKQLPSIANQPVSFKL